MTTHEAIKPNQIRLGDHHAGQAKVISRPHAGYWLVAFPNSSTAVLSDGAIARKYPVVARPEAVVA